MEAHLAQQQEAPRTVEKAAFGRTLVTAARVALVTLVLTGLLYPLATTGAAQLIFPRAANGSLVKDDRGQTVGSALIGQSFQSGAYLQPRPSAAGKGYDASASSGSNLGPTSAALRERARSEAVRLRADNPEAPGPVPAELVTTSASGLDPALSLGAALWQAPRIAKARGVSVDRVRQVILDNLEGRALGFLGEPRVNVLAVNLAFDRQFGAPGASP